MLEQIIPYAVSIVSILLVAACSKWLHVSISREKLEPLLFGIINLITTVEKDPAYRSGREKQKAVVEKMKKTFPQKDLNFLQKIYKNLDVAVEKAFQLSHLSHFGRSCC